MSTPTPRERSEPEALPRGTVTLLFTDIQGSTRLLRELGRERYVDALEEHRRLLRREFRAHGGSEVGTEGDSFFFAFPLARDAVAGAVAAQRALHEHPWPDRPVEVRMGIHTGEPMQAHGGYAGLDVHRAARVMSAACGSQVLVSARTADLVDGELPDHVGLHDLGEYELKDFPGPQHLYAVEADALSLEPPTAVQRAGAPAGTRRKRRALIAVGTILAALAVLTVYLVTRPGDDPLVAAPGSVAVIDPDTNRVVTVVPAGTTPTSIVSGGGSVWTLNTGDGTISRIDAKSRERVKTIPVGYGASDIAYAGAAIWVANAIDDVLSAVDDTGAVDKKIPLGIPHARRRSGSLATIALAPRGNEIWATGGNGLPTVIVDARGGTVIRRFAGRRGIDADSSPVGPDVASGDAGVWATPGTDELVELGVRDGSVVQLGGFDGDQGVTSVAVGADVWAAGAGVAWQVRPGLARPTATFPVGRGPTGIALGAGSVWTANSLDGTVTRIDPQSGTASTIRVGGTPGELVASDGLIWVTVG